MDIIPVRNLGDFAITNAVTDRVLTSSQDENGVAIDYLDRLGGAQAVDLYANFSAGNGAGTSAIARVRTRLDGVNWVEIARFDFGNTNDAKFCRLIGSEARAITSVAALDAEGIRQGILGPDFQAILTTVGVFGGNASISLRLQPRY